MTYVSESIIPGVQFSAGRDHLIVQVPGREAVTLTIAEIERIESCHLKPAKGGGHLCLVAVLWREGDWSRVAVLDELWKDSRHAEVEELGRRLAGVLGVRHIGQVHNIGHDY